MLSMAVPTCFSPRFANSLDVATLWDWFIVGVISGVAGFSIPQDATDS